MKEANQNIVAISKNVDVYVLEHGTTKDAIAKHIGISRSSLYDKLNGKRPWMLNEAIDLASLMGCTVADLITPPAIAVA
jgi:DNA-binding XRE family transcriptional regulator